MSCIGAATHSGGATQIRRRLDLLPSQASTFAKAMEDTSARPEFPSLNKTIELAATLGLAEWGFARHVDAL